MTVAKKKNLRPRSFISPVGLPSSLICHENGAFRQRSSGKPEEVENAGFAF